MRTLLLLIAASMPLFAQNDGWDVLEGPTNVVISRNGAISEQYTYFVFSNPNGTKILVLEAKRCKGYSVFDQECTRIPKTEFVNWGPVKRTVENFEIHYGLTAPTAVQYEGVSLGGSQQANAKLIVLEAKSDAELLLFDLVTFATTNPVTLPNGSRTFGVRPSQTGTAREIWTAHCCIGNQITITNLNTPKVEAALPTKLDENATPINIVFSNSGKTAYYVVAFLNPDANGNKGAMLIFDATARTLKSTIPLSIRPTSFLMAPDGLTAYIIGEGKIIYFDILSGTGDLVANFPGIIASSGQQFIHPDSIRIFSLQTAPYAITVFDLAQRKLVNTFPIKFATGLPVKMDLAKDGNSLTLLSNKDEVQTVDVLTGQVTSFFQGNPGTSDVFTAPVLQ